jgi:hypothetical protein
MKADYRSVMLKLACQLIESNALARMGLEARAEAALFTNLIALMCLRKDEPQVRNVGEILLYTLKEVQLAVATWDNPHPWKSEGDKLTLLLSARDNRALAIFQPLWDIALGNYEKLDQPYQFANTDEATREKDNKQAHDHGAILTIPKDAPALVKQLIPRLMKTSMEHGLGHDANDRANASFFVMCAHIANIENVELREATIEALSDAARGYVAMNRHKAPSIGPHGGRGRGHAR